MSRKRWARSVSFELDGDLYAVDLEKGYRPLGSRNSSWTRDKWRGAVNEDNSEEFSGMGLTAKPTTTNKLTPPASLKVTYRYVFVLILMFNILEMKKIIFRLYMD